MNPKEGWDIRWSQVGVNLIRKGRGRLGNFQSRGGPERVRGDPGGARLERGTAVPVCRADWHFIVTVEPLMTLRRS